MDNSLLEKFTPINGHERFGVNALGEVINFKKQRKVSQVNVNGYRMVKLDGILYYVHRLVANAFIPNSEPVTRINVSHLDGDRSNNIIFNLKWATNSEIQTRRFKKL